MTIKMTASELTQLLLTARAEYWAERDGSGLVFGVRNTSDPVAYKQAIVEAVQNLNVLGFRVRFLKPSTSLHSDKAMAKVFP